ncbi:BgTH12-00819 [Blumeria graminis f. sp. triticale]|uniref:eIF-2-alpha kinase activator GCN1 n=1 Tax=Blumeria graminis f. sp. triticale TaxID=1689686 RepID=A0A9W4GHW7_BLUGR|nr:BgTH12-00819 [Blumeria graminis f. sp. triticale]
MIEVALTDTVTIFHDFLSLRKQLLCSSTKIRLASLQAIELRLKELEKIDPDVSTPLLDLLFSTYHSYHERNSRRSVERCIRLIFRSTTSPETLASFVRKIGDESSKHGIGQTDALILVKWCSAILQEISDLTTWQIWGYAILECNARALESCVATEHRPQVKKSAYNSTRRGLKGVLSKDPSGSRMCEVIAEFCSKSSPVYAVMLGMIAGVCADNLKESKQLETMKPEFYAFYLREIIGSKTKLPSHQAAAMADYFSNFAQEDEIQNIVAPALERAILRAPEVVLNDLIRPLVISLPSSIDLSNTLQKNLLKPLLSNIRSSSSTTRLGSLLTFKSIAYRSRDPEISTKICEEILNLLEHGKTHSADQRASYAEMLAAITIPKDSISKLCVSLALLAAKETNETALSSDTSSLLLLLTQSVNHGLNVDHRISESFLKGISDKRSATRRVWSICLGELYWEAAPAALTSNLSSLTDIVFPQLYATWDSIISNSVVASQLEHVTCAHIFTAISRSKLAESSPEIKSKIQQAKIPQKVLAIEPKPSFLMNPRVYGKLTSDDECKWFIRALVSHADDLISIEAESPISVSWSQAFIYCICSSAFKFNLRKDAAHELSKIYLLNPCHISKLIITGIWRWILSTESKEKDSAAMISRTGNHNLHYVVRSICPIFQASHLERTKVSEPTRRQQMISLLVLSRPEIIPGISWIDLCLRTGVDPGELALNFTDELMFEIMKHTDANEKTNVMPPAFVKEAAYSAAAELAFIAPEKMTNVIMKLVQQDLDTKSLSNIGPTEAAIFRTEEGNVFVDVIASNSKSYYPNKNVKDYDILKWEDEVRAQLSQKFAQKKKLTPEEKLKVNDQIKKEARIRQEVRIIEAKILRGSGIIRNLVNGPPTEPSLWIRTAVKSLLDVMKSGSSLITGSVTSEVYISCAQKLPNRIGGLGLFIGIASLRALNIQQLPENLIQEPLGPLITRVLYRLRFSGEQRPFDNVSLIYILPLILLVLQNGGFGESDDADAQVVLCLEFLSFHTDSCADIAVPREDVLSVLITSMQIYNQHYKILKDCLADFCRCIAPNITRSEINILLRGSIVTQTPVRTAVLQSISADIDLTEFEFSDEIWLACHDDKEENARLGREIWDENGFELTEILPSKMLPYLGEKDIQIRRAASKALSEAIRFQPHTFSIILENLKSSYQDLAMPLSPQLDEYGMPKKLDHSDFWEPRHGVALAMKEIATIFDDKLLDSFIYFLIEAGPLGEKNPKVREEMIEAGISIITLQGKSNVEGLMKTLEQTIVAPDKGSESADRVNEAVIIMYGALARHLKVGDPRILKVVNRLLETLGTPSEVVQYAVAECLPPLVRASIDNTSEYVQYVLDRLFNSKNYAGRRGAAYGLAGVVQGKGISALREYRIMSTLKTGMENKKISSHREGSLLAYELLSSILCRVFEPYVIQIVPQLLAGFGDISTDVRDSCLAAAKACFAQLSSFGVKRILPTLLEGLDDSQWRIKKGACDLLGAMAFLDPQQLAKSLPEIIPSLTGVLNDSHKEVRTAANRSLKRFGEVINNPEIKSLVEILLKALSDPTKYTDNALDSLIKVSFVHYLDAPSLALVVRILERGLGDRSATKRKSAQVIGSLAHLTERKDLVAHLPILVAGLKIAIVDPVPTTRATASKALGSLTEKLGEDVLPDLIPSLMQTLRSDTGAGDRLGSAQALSEVLAGLGTTRLDETLPTILQNASSSKPEIREGFISLFIFLPVCFGNSFANYLTKVIPVILQGLADEVESIRETSLRAGRLLVKNFSTRSIELLLPELERGLFDDNYRIRLSSTELIGDLLFNLTGIKVETEQDDEDTYEAVAASASLLAILGEEKRNKVLSALYICRCDTSGLVRTAAVRVWKALVANPRTLKELIPTLTKLIVDRLGSSPEQKEIAGNALSELVRKAGDGVLSSLLPVLEEGLRSTDADAKQGICIALRELIGSASPEALEDHEKTLISVVRIALIDPNSAVRESAAEAFDSLQQILGKRAVDQVLPYLLSLLRTDSDAENALAALLTLLTETTRSSIILPNLIPTLVAIPISSFNAKALASLSMVSGSALTRKLPIILHALVDSIVSCQDEEILLDLEASLDAVILSIDEFDGLNTAMSVILALVKHEDYRKRATIDQHLAKFFASATIDYSRYNQEILRALLNSFDDRDHNVVKAAWDALNEFTKRLRKEEMEMLVISTRQTLKCVGVPGVDLPGFSLPKGINAILPIFLQGLVNGSIEQRVQSALAISDVIERTNGDSLKPFVAQITGPLIRVVSERSVEVKSSILFTLNNLLEKIPALLKPFLPQLQRTFAKCLADTSSEILRNRAALALGTLIRLVPRIDPLIAEICIGARSNHAGVKCAMLKALNEIIRKSGANMNESSRAAILCIIDTDFEDSDLSITIIIAKLIGVIIRFLPHETAANLIKNRILSAQISSSSILALNASLSESPSSLMINNFGNDILPAIHKGIESKNNFISDNSVIAAGKYLLSEIRSNDFESLKATFKSLANVIQPGTAADTRRLALVVIRTVCRHHLNIVRPHLSLLAIPVFANVRDPVIPIKLAAEAAFMALFSVVNDESKIFDKFISSQELPLNQKNIMQDYFKRVALRLANTARERRDAEGGENSLGLSNDELDDEREIWSIGKVELGGESIDH